MNFKNVMAANDAKIAETQKRESLEKVVLWNSDEKDTSYLTYFMTLLQIEQVGELCERLGFPLNYILIPHDSATPIWGE
jgi:hypothetical protein